MIHPPISNQFPGPRSIGGIISLATKICEEQRGREGINSVWVEDDWRLKQHETPSTEHSLHPKKTESSNGRVCDCCDCGSGGMTWWCLGCLRLQRLSYLSNHLSGHPVYHLQKKSSDFRMVREILFIQLTALQLIPISTENSDNQWAAQKPLPTLKVAEEKINFDVVLSPVLKLA